jgi:hypothetical protein
MAFFEHIFTVRLKHYHNIVSKLINANRILPLIVIDKDSAYLNVLCLYLLSFP